MAPCLSCPHTRILLNTITVPLPVNVDSSLFLPLPLRTRPVRPSGIDNGAMQVPRRRDAWRWFPPFTHPGVPANHVLLCARVHTTRARGRIESDGRSRDGEGFRGKGRGTRRYGEGVQRAFWVRAHVRFGPLNYNTTWRSIGHIYMRIKVYTERHHTLVTI